jgi:uncharacterized protein (DUF433 family)
MTIRHPFPGAVANSDVCSGILRVEGTDVPVGRILAELAQRGVDVEPTCGRISKYLNLNGDTVRKCLRGLAGWLEAHDWICAPSVEQLQREIVRGYQDGKAEHKQACLSRWLDSLAADVLRPDYPEEEIHKELREAGYDPDEVGRKGAALALYLLRHRKARGKKTQEQEPESKPRTTIERHCKNCVSWLPDLLRTDKCVYPYCVKACDPEARAKLCGHWQPDNDAEAPNLCPRCRSTNRLNGKCNDCGFDRSDPTGEKQKIANEKRCRDCGTYGSCPWIDYAIGSEQYLAGPPWPDCRFWKPKEE